MLHVKTDELYGKNPIVNSSDLRTRLVSIDSRFRSDVAEPSTDFHYRFAHPYKNIIKARIASVEIPAVIYNFSKAKKNTMFRVDVVDYTGTLQSLMVQIPDGDYSTEQLISAINEQFRGIKDMYGIFFRMVLDPITKRVGIYHDGTAPPSAPPAPTHCPVGFGLTFLMVGMENRPFDFGLGSCLGFMNGFYEVGEPFSIIGESPVQIQGDDYLLLNVADFHTVEHKTHDNYLQSLAKIIIRRPAAGSDSSILFHPGHTVLSNEIIFPRAVDLSSIRIQLVDRYGAVVDLHQRNFSLSLELTEVMNMQLYDNYRTYLWTDPEPRATQKVNGSAAPIAPPALNYK